MNKFIEMAKNRSNHTVEELKKNAMAALADVPYYAYRADADEYYYAYRAVYTACHAADTANATATDVMYWNSECEKYIKRYEKLTKGEKK